MNRFKWIAGLVAASVLTIMISACAPTAHQEGTGGYIDDTVITTKVKSELLADEQLKHSDQISVETFKGRVQLSGFISSPKMASRAVAITRSVAGVTSVINNLHVR
ncbi:hypothetical protein BL250_06405 [Erwinia sp. OLTSP20]|uniref:BON domain-containing protein n=1 Tax=unclassified Erwinia TaxID=2622719 RepID=UPI000C1A7F35|nr:MULTISPECIES: BON domain-containing protein [unclassified Erwinia]PIJ51814.1 hypothetical protein BV501_02430 [Erwinia sp. OAMSP11]PIJ74402.1 hypothetical protein BK416_04360 [Erwinia sp. OLSSP12]PIJ83765.1 hypothetical protein BLD47_03765 [Erwinia sp. OLCASP19]PIJ86808.1 hypothetical protein BLD46_02260 [Erwinia sp. OLMTSP26]PIJ88215.1 hypothetical protein BLD49_02940 [Erwinia sp. OLMDSP33]